MIIFVLPPHPQMRNNEDIQKVLSGINGKNMCLSSHFRKTVKVRVIRPRVLLWTASYCWCLYGRVKSSLWKRATLRQCLWNVLQTFISLLQTLPLFHVLLLWKDEGTVWPVFDNWNWSAVTDQLLKSRSLLSVITW